jgi:hypothetical protein
MQEVCVKGHKEKNKHGNCRACDRVRSQNYRKNHPDRRKITIDNWKRNNPEKYAKSIRRKNTQKNGWALGEFEKAELAKEKENIQCGCCGHNSPRTKRGWQADHDHKTGKFRALLCHPCNSIIGFIERHGIKPSDQQIDYIQRFL